MRAGTRSPATVSHIELYSGMNDQVSHRKRCFATVRSLQESGDVNHRNWWRHGVRTAPCRSLENSRRTSSDDSGLLRALVATTPAPIDTSQWDLWRLRPHATQNVRKAAHVTGWRHTATRIAYTTGQSDRRMHTALSQEGILPRKGWPG